MMDGAKNGYQATPPKTLEQQMMDACAPKNEREWWAFVEIGRLRAEVASLTAQLQSGESFHSVAVRQRDAAWREVEALKATMTQQCKGFRADVEKLEAEVEALRADSDRLDFLDTNLSRNFGWQVAIAPAGKVSVQSVAYPASPPVPIRFAIDAARAAQGGRG